MKLCVIGTGFVGVVSSAVFASFGNQVVGLDVDENKIEKLKQGIVPFYEPGLTELLLEQQGHGNLSFTCDYQAAIQDADVIMIAVGTPSAPDGQADLKYVLAASESLAPHLKNNAIVVIKSTVPPGTLEKVEAKIKQHTQVRFFTASVPEFLKEGTAVFDTLNPDRIIIGADDPGVFETLSELHRPFNAPIVKISPESAQMAKYAANSYLATRITFINQVADLCEKNGADIQDVIQAIGFDKRIGKHYWYPGFGYGGSCFPKDVKELAAYSRAIGESGNLLNKVSELNEERIAKLLDGYGAKMGGWEGKKIAVLGLSFKPQTDDMREAPSVKVIPYLTSHGSTVMGYDPKALPVVSSFIPEHPQASYTDSIHQAVKNADVVIALIEWPEIIGFDFAPFGNSSNSTSKWFIDARNQFDKQKVLSWGYQYLGVGRS